MSRSTTRSTAGRPPAPSALLLDRAVIQRQLGHTNLGITCIYLRGIDSAEIIDTVHARRDPHRLTARLDVWHPTATGVHTTVRRAFVIDELLPSRGERRCESPLRTRALGWTRRRDARRPRLLHSMLSSGVARRHRGQVAAVASATLR